MKPPRPPHLTDGSARAQRPARASAVQRFVQFTLDLFDAEPEPQAGPTAPATPVFKPKQPVVHVPSGVVAINNVANKSRTVETPLADAVAPAGFAHPRANRTVRLGDATVAFDAWLAARPFENPDAPPHPFVTNLYQPRLLTEAREAEAESARMAQLSRSVLDLWSVPHRADAIPLLSSVSRRWPIWPSHG